MEAMFLNVIGAISESRFWVMPMLLFCVTVILVAEIIRIAQEDIDDFK